MCVIQSGARKTKLRKSSMSTVSGLPDYLRYVELLNQEISGVPEGTPDPLYLDTGDNQFLVTLTAEQWRKIYDCLLLGADFLYPEESHDIMFSWVKQLEWPEECEETVQGFKVQVAKTAVSDVSEILVTGLPSSYDYLQVNAFLRSHKSANVDTLGIELRYDSDADHYNSRMINAQGGAVGTVTWGFGAYGYFRMDSRLCAASLDSDLYSNLQFTLWNYAYSGVRSVKGQMSYFSTSSASAMSILEGIYRVNASSIGEFRLFAEGGNLSGGYEVFVAGSNL